MTRRNIELVLLCIAAPIVIIMFAMIAIEEGQSLNIQTLGVPVGMFGSFIIAHFAVRKFAKGADPAILPIAFTLAGIGIAFLIRIDPDLAVNQTIWLFVGIVCMILIIVLLKSIDKLANFKYTFMIIGLILLLSPLIPGLGQEIYGSRIWLEIGPFSFQPGELAKVFIVMFLAGYLAANREMLSIFTVRLGPFNLPDIKTLIPLLLMWIIAFMIVVFEKDLGSALVFFFVFLTMLYTATGKKFYLTVGFIMAVIGGLAAWVGFSHVQDRVDIWLDPFADPNVDGYQIVQSLYSLADGDLFGTGIGRGLAGGGNGITAIPVAESDFIFTVIAEETGLLGAAGILLLYLCFAIRGLVTAARAKSDISSFIAVGLTATIVLQAFIIVGGVTRLIPLTGLTLPFISQGGSSLLVSFLSVGFLLKCGDQGTGVGEELKSGTAAIHSNSVLGRVSLGKRLTNLMIIFSVMFALLVANLTMIMVVQAEDYRNMAGNNHSIAKEARSERGTISTSDGIVLARSEQTADGTFERVYPEGDLASHVVGYYSLRFGTSGIENTYNNTLRGEENYASWTDVLNAAAGISTAGNDITLTLNSTIQRAAQDALLGNSGACVVMDPKTGEVLAMASSPTYEVANVETLLNSNSGTGASSELLNRATQALYAPGSTFKTLTLATAFENNIAQESTVYDSPGEMEIGGGMVTSYDKNNYGSITLARAMELSSNTVFGQLGVQIGAELLVSSAERFGFNQELDLEVASSKSLMPVANEMTTWETAWAAVGQPVGQHESDAGPQASALQMALITCGLANGGTIMKPYFVEGIYNANGTRSYTAAPSVFSQPISPSTANRVVEVMKGVVNRGTGTAAAISGVQVAGKTGTAETGKPTDDSWFVGLAPADNPEVVIAIVIEEGAGSNRDASARARNVLTVALQAEGLL